LFLDTVFELLSNRIGLLDALLLDLIESFVSFRSLLLAKLFHHTQLLLLFFFFDFKLDEALPDLSVGLLGLIASLRP